MRHGPVTEDPASPYLEIKPILICGISTVFQWCLIRMIDNQLCLLPWFVLLNSQDLHVCRARDEENQDDEFWRDIKAAWGLGHLSFRGNHGEGFRAC